MRYLMLLLCTMGLLLACESYEDDYRRTYHSRHAVYREGYYRGPYSQSYAYPRRAYSGAIYRYGVDRSYPRPYYRVDRRPGYYYR